MSAPNPCRKFPMGMIFIPCYKGITLIYNLLHLSFCLRILMDFLSLSHLILSNVQPHFLYWCFRRTVFTFHLHLYMCMQRIGSTLISCHLTISYFYVITFYMGHLTTIEKLELQSKILNFKHIKLLVNL